MAATGIFSNLREQVMKVLRNISIEPSVLLYTITSGLGSIVAQDLYIQKVCLVNLEFPDDVCKDIQKHEEEQQEVQEYVSGFKIYKILFRSLPTIIFTLLAGPWSDEHGRKPVIVLALLGHLLANLSFLTSAYFFHDLRAEYLLFELLESCLGGQPCFVMAVFAYIADITKAETRTKRMAVLSAMWPTGLAIGKTLGALVKEKVGYVANFTLGSILPILAIAHTVCILKEGKQEERVDYNEDNKDKERMPSTHMPWHTKIKKFLHYRNIISGIKVLLVKRPHNKRILLLGVVICFGLEMAVNTGDYYFRYLYLRRKLEWTLIDYTMLQNLWNAIAIVTQLVLMPVLTQKLAVADSAISIVDSATSTVQHLIFAVATQGWMVYMGELIAFLDGTSQCVLRSIATKLTNPNETGKVFSAIAVISDRLVPLVIGPLIGATYRTTVSFLPETIYYLMTGMYSIFVLIMVLVHVGLRIISQQESTRNAVDKDADEPLNLTRNESQEGQDKNVTT